MITSTCLDWIRKYCPKFVGKVRGKKFCQQTRIQELSSLAETQLKKNGFFPRFTWKKSALVWTKCVGRNEILKKEKPQLKTCQDFVNWILKITKLTSLLFLPMQWKYSWSYARHPGTQTFAKVNLPKNSACKQIFGLNDVLYSFFTTLMSRILRILL